MRYNGDTMADNLIPEKKNSGRDLDIGDCPAVSPSGFLCTRNRNHTGLHDAKGVNNQSFMTWSDKAPYYPERGVSRQDD